MEQIDYNSPPINLRNTYSGYLSPKISLIRTVHTHLPRSLQRGKWHPRQQSSKSICADELEDFKQLVQSLEERVRENDVEFRGKLETSFQNYVSRMKEKQEEEVSS